MIMIQMAIRDFTAMFLIKIMLSINHKNCHYDDESDYKAVPW